jgi:hypothetical protein
MDIEIYLPYAQIAYDYQGYFSELPDIHTLGIEIIAPYAQICGDSQLTTTLF